MSLFDLIILAGLICLFAVAGVFIVALVTLFDD